MKVDADTIWGAVKSLKDKYPHMAVDRLESANPDTADRIFADVVRNPSDVVACMEWLALCPRRNTYTLKFDTQQYKHEVELWRGGRWASHTSMMVAVELSGMDMKPDPARSWAGLLKLGHHRPGSSYAEVSNHA